MSSSVKTTSGAPLNPPPSTSRKSPSIRRGSSTTTSPKVGSANPGSQSPRPSSPLAVGTAGTPPLQDLTTLLNLPLRLTIVASGALPEHQVEGTLWTYDPSTSFVVLSSPAPELPAAAAAGPTTAQNPASNKRSYHLIKSTQIKSVTVLSLSPDPALPDPTELLRAVNLKDAEARVEKAVREDQRLRARIGQGVSEEAQALFDALGKTLPVRWHDQSIVVMDEVIISPPYGPADVKGGKGAGERIERVRKVLEGERQRRTERPVGGS